MVVDEDGAEHRGRRLVVATGLSPNVPDIPGIELAEGYESVSVDRAEFANQRVLILGKGNSAFEIADNLLDTASLIHLASGRSIRFAWNTRHPGHVRADYTRILDTYQLKLLHGVLDCTVTKIERQEGALVASIAYTHADGECEEIAYDRVIRCTGFRFDGSAFDGSCQPATCLDGRLPAMTSAWESVDVPGMYFAGTLMQARDFERASSAFIDGFRYNIRSLFHVLRDRYEGVALPGSDVSPDPGAVAEAILDRICRTSGLWAQFGFLCDVLAVRPDGSLRYFTELPVDYVHESDYFREGHYFTITFEWGTWSGDVFAIERFPDQERAEKGAFLHPIIRHFRGDELRSRHDVLEDLFGMYCAEKTVNVRRANSGRKVAEYYAEQHRAPLIAYLSEEIG